MFGNEPYILNQEDCPTHEAWMAYAENRCDKQQERAMEMHLQTCPLCAEAVEIYMTGQGSDVTKIHDFVLQNIDSQSNVKVVSIWKRIAPFAIAASLLLGFFFIKYTNNQDIGTSITQQTTQQNTTTQSKEIGSEGNSSIAIVADEATDRKAAEKEPIIMKKAKASSLEENNAVAFNDTNKNKIDMDTPSAAMVEPTKSDTSEPTAPMTKVSKQHISEKDATLEQLSLAQNYFKTQNYTQAIAAYKAILMMDTDNQEALFYLGKSEMAIGNHQNALNPLERVNSSLFYDEAQWELAQSCLKINKLVKAKRILKALSEKENVFQNQAKELLKNL